MRHFALYSNYSKDNRISNAPVFSDTPEPGEFRAGITVIAKITV